MSYMWQAAVEQGVWAEIDPNWAKASEIMGNKAGQQSCSCSGWKDGASPTAALLRRGWRVTARVASTPLELHGHSSSRICSACICVCVCSWSMDTPAGSRESPWRAWWQQCGTVPSHIPAASGRESWVGKALRRCVLGVFLRYQWGKVYAEPSRLILNHKRHPHWKWRWWQPISETWCQDVEVRMEMMC